MSQIQDKVVVTGTAASRSEELDFLKGVLILLMISFHLVYFSETHPYAKQIVYTFHMPGFLIISGYLMNIGKQPKAFCRTILSYLLPYLGMESGYIVMASMLPIREHIDSLTIGTFLDTLFLHPIGPYWYLHTLVICGIIYYLVFRYLSIKTLSRFIAIGLIFYAISTLGVMSFGCSMYFLAGAVLRHSRLSFNDVFQSSSLAIIAFILLVVHPQNLLMEVSGGIMIVYLSISVILLIAQYTPDRLRRLVLYLGRNTLALFLFSPIFTFLCKPLAAPLAFDGTALIFLFISLCICASGSLLVMWVLRYLYQHLISMRKTVILVIGTMFALPLMAQPKLQRQGTATQLVVNGQPMLVLGGELSNSAATCIADIDAVMPRMKAIGLNTVIVPAYWELMEPKEDVFDFSLIDETILKARENQLKVIFLWFGAWKNSMSCYAPLWFKKDIKRFPRAMTETGKPMEIASAFSDEVLKADNKAFSRLMQHIADIDSKENTVIMMQVENEIGMLESARDFSPLAEKAWKSPVPTELLKAMKLKQKGTWEQVFGNGLEGQEKFQAYHYARYVEQLCLSARKIYDIPLYVNAALNSRGRKPGQYPSAGPLAHLMDIWHCAAPHIDFLSPDIYDTGFKDWVAQYKTPSNPFFTPEVRLSSNSGVRALYVFGETDAIGYSPFAIDQADAASSQSVSRAYQLLSELSPLALKYQGKGSSWGLLFDGEDLERVIDDGEVTLTCRHYYTLPWDSRATDGSTWPEGGGIIIRLNPYEYLIAGSGIVISFQTKAEKALEENIVRGEDGFVLNEPSAETNLQSSIFNLQYPKRIGIGSVDQVKIDDKGQLHYLRRLNGDQDHQGRHARISCDDYQILHIQLYNY